MNERSAVMMCAVLGGILGALAGYMFLTEAGRDMRDRMEPAVDDLKNEFARFQRTFQKVGDMASEGMRVFEEFNQARTQATGSMRSH